MFQRHVHGSFHCMQCVVETAFVVGLANDELLMAVPRHFVMECTRDLLVSRLLRRSIGNLSSQDTHFDRYRQKRNIPVL
jgi:hypothetical protein